jgi:hypothetical protein
MLEIRRFFVFLQSEMKKATNILSSTILLTMILLGTMGVSVEKCSCTGKISLVLPTESDCCPDESDCMTMKSMHLSDYMPTTTACIDLPVQPVLFAVFPPVVSTALRGHSALCPYKKCDLFSPGELAHTIDVLRV